jgi:hypothetical protein
VVMRMFEDLCVSGVVWKLKTMKLYRVEIT